MTTQRTDLTDVLSDDEKLEIDHLSQWARHDDTMIYQAASTVLPLSFGAVAVAVQFPKMVIPLALFSVVLYAYWLLIATRLSWFSSVRLYRLRELESKSSLNHHSLLKKPPRELSSRFGSWISIRSIRWLGLIVLLVAWLITFSQISDSTPPPTSTSIKGTAAGKTAPAS